MFHISTLFDFLTYIMFLASENVDFTELSHVFLLGGGKFQAVSFSITLPSEGLYISFVA